MAELSAVQQALTEELVDRLLGEFKVKLNREDFLPLIEKDIKDLINAAVAPLPLEKRRMVAMALDPDLIKEHGAMKFLMRYESPGRALKPCLLIGDQGSGKTTVATQFALSQPFQHVIFMQGDEGMDAQSMRGGLRPFPAGGATTTVWQDGELAEAFRLAAKEEATCLYVDEYYRIKARERSPFISGLSPIRYPDGRWYYIVKTGRIMDVVDGLVTGSEIIKAPCEMISIVASTNVGAGFDVQQGDPAEAGRWLQFDMQTTEESVKRIIGSVLKDYGMSISLTSKFVKILNEGKKLFADNFLALEPDIRILCDGIKMARNEMDIGNTLLDAALVWVGRDIKGHRIPEQLDQLRRLIERHFPLRTTT